jgi:hypothetical protein
MKRIVFPILLTMALCSLPFTAFAAKAVQVDILYMNHGPLLPSIKEIKEVLSQYGDKVTVSWYDFETKEGETFMEKRGIRQHVPLIIWLDGKYTLSLGGSDVKFVGFPSGSGPLPFQGKWTMADLRKALDQVIGTK